VHGVLAHGRRFAPLAAAGLAERFRVVAPDLRGHGASTWEPPWSLEQHVEDLLDSAPAGPALWVGHSFGGRLVLELAAAHPERVERAVLLDPALWVPPPIALEEADAIRAEQTFASVEEAVAARVASGLDLTVHPSVLAEDFRVSLEPAADGRLRFRYGRSSVVAAYGELARTPPLAELGVPVRIVRATGSRVCPVELVDALREHWGASVELVEVPGGHNLMWDAPRETAAAIAAFMQPGGG
jgi:lipase